LVDARLKTKQKKTDM